MTSSCGSRPCEIADWYLVRTLSPWDLVSQAPSTAVMTMIARVVGMPIFEPKIRKMQSSRTGIVMKRMRSRANMGNVSYGLDGETVAGVQ